MIHTIPIHFKVTGAAEVAVPGNLLTDEQRIKLEFRLEREFTKVLREFGFVPRVFNAEARPADVRSCERTVRNGVTGEDGECGWTGAVELDDGYWECPRGHEHEDLVQL